MTARASTAGCCRRSRRSAARSHRPLGSHGHRPGPARWPWRCAPRRVERRARLLPQSIDSSPMCRLAASTSRSSITCPPRNGARVLTVDDTPPGPPAGLASPDPPCSRPCRGLCQGSAQRAVRRPLPPPPAAPLAPPFRLGPSAEPYGRPDPPAQRVGEVHVRHVPAEYGLDGVLPHFERARSGGGSARTAASTRARGPATARSAAPPSVLSLLPACSHSGAIRRSSSSRVSNRLGAIVRYRPLRPGRTSHPLRVDVRIARVMPTQHSRRFSARPPLLDRRPVRQHPFLAPGQGHHVELLPLGRVQRHQDVDASRLPASRGRQHRRVDARVAKPPQPLPVFAARLVKTRSRGRRRPARKRATRAQAPASRPIPVRRRSAAAAGRRRRRPAVAPRLALLVFFASRAPPGSSA